MFDLHAGVGDPLHDHALYIKVGLVPGDGGAYFLPRIVGPAKALELLLTGDFVDAEEALRMGMVNRVYDDEELMVETRKFAEKLAAGRHG